MTNTKKITKDVLVNEVDHGYVLDCVSSMDPLNINAFLSIKAYFVESLVASYSNDFEHVGNNVKGCDILHKPLGHTIEIKSYKSLLKPKKDRKDKELYTSKFVLVNSRNHIVDRQFTPADFYYLVDTENYSVGVAPGEKLVLADGIESTKKIVSGKFRMEDVDMLVSNWKPTTIPRVERDVTDLVTAKFVQCWRNSPT